MFKKALVLAVALASFVAYAAERAAVLPVCGVLARLAAGSRSSDLDQRFCQPREAFANLHRVAE